MPQFLLRMLRMPIIRHDYWRKPLFVTRWAHGICMRFSANEWQSLEVCRWVDHCELITVIMEFRDNQGIIKSDVVVGRWRIGDNEASKQKKRNVSQHSLLQHSSSTLHHWHKNTSFPKEWFYSNELLFSVLHYTARPNKYLFTFCLNKTIRRAFH